MQDNQVQIGVIDNGMMPEMDGYAFVQAIRSDVLTSHIPINLLTAKASDEHKLSGLQVGADAYLTKTLRKRPFATAAEEYTMKQ